MAIIPAKNPMALIGYYLGVGSLVPVLGLLVALPAIICGVFGIVKANANPQVGGMGHAITAIVLGIVGPVGWALVAMFLL